MLYISPENEYPRHYGDIQLDHPDFKLGDDLPEGWKKVESVEPPKTVKYEVSFEDFPELIDGVYYQNWQVREMTDEEKARVDAPETAKAKLLALGLTEIEIEALSRGLR